MHPLLKPGVPRIEHLGLGTMGLLSFGCTTTTGRTSRLMATRRLRVPRRTSARSLRRPCLAGYITATRAPRSSTRRPIQGEGVSSVRHGAPRGDLKPPRSASSGRGRRFQQGQGRRRPMSGASPPPVPSHGLFVAQRRARESPRNRLPNRHPEAAPRESGEAVTEKGSAHNRQSVDRGRLAPLIDRQCVVRPRPWPQSIVSLRLFDPSPCGRSWSHGPVRPPFQSP